MPRPVTLRELVRAMVRLRRARRRLRPVFRAKPKSCGDCRSNLEGEALRLPLEVARRVLATVRPEAIEPLTQSAQRSTTGDEVVLNVLSCSSCRTNWVSVYCVGQPDLQLEPTQVADNRVGTYKGLLRDLTRGYR